MRLKQGDDNILFGALFRKPLNREQYMGARGFKNFFMLIYRVMDARGKFGEHEKCVRVLYTHSQKHGQILL